MNNNFLMKKSTRALLALSLFGVCSEYALSSAEQKLIQKAEKGDAHDLFKLCEYCKTYATNLPALLSPTGIHLKNNLQGLTNPIVGQYIANSELMDFISQIIKRERSYNKHGYYTFLHGQKRAYLFAEKMYTFLWQISQKQEVENFLFAHVKPLLETQQEKDDEEQMRQYLLAYGRKPKDPVTRQKLLFLNFGLFNQLKDVGSNTAYYVANNKNWGSSPITISVHDSFKLLGYEDIYYKFQKELDDLEAKYTKGNYGNILMVAVPKNKIKEYVFLCHAGKGHSGIGGVKRTISIPGTGNTDDISIIMKALTHQPETFNCDDLEFCLIMTQKDGGLDPRTGIKIEPIISGDKKEIAELQKKENELCKRIKEAIEG